jgi:uncharacterized membrane protein (UPF0127 family)
LRTLRIVDSRNGALIAGRARLCDSLWSRFRGLMLRPNLPEGEAIVLSPCGSVHMALMRFAIDVLYLDRSGRAVKLVRNLKPYRISLGGRHAHAALELPAGTLDRLGVAAGDPILLEDEAGTAATV